MSLRIYMDHNVHGAIVAGLRQRGQDVLTAWEDGRHQAADPALLSRADELNRVFFTHDDDLLAEAHRRQRLGEHFDGLVYAHPYRITIAQGIEDLELIAEVFELHDVENRVFYLPL